MLWLTSFYGAPEKKTLAYALVRSDCHTSKEETSDLGLHLDFKANKVTVLQGLGHAVIFSERPENSWHALSHQTACNTTVERI